MAEPFAFRPELHGVLVTSFDLRVDCVVTHDEIGHGAGFEIGRPACEGAFASLGPRIFLGDHVVQHPSVS